MSELGMRRLRYSMQKRGIAASVTEVVHRIRRLRHNRALLYYMPTMPVEWTACPPKTKTVRVRTLDELGKYMSSIAEQKEPVAFESKVRRRLDSGAELWLATVDGHVAGFEFTRLGTPPEGFYMPLSPASLFVFDAETFAAYRGCGISPALTAGITTAAYEAGISNIYMTIREWNRSSRRIVEKLGLVLIGRARKLRLWGGRMLVLWRHMG